MELFAEDEMPVSHLLALVPFKACNELPESSLTNEILNFFLQLEVVFGIIIMVSMILAVLSVISSAGI